MQLLYYICFDFCRTCKSLLTLLEESEVSAIHLYALWTIANLCYFNGKSYFICLMHSIVAIAW